MSAIVVTRDEDSDGTLTRALRRLGHDVVHWPVLRIGPPADARPLERARKQLTAFDWIVFPSRNAVVALGAAPKRSRTRKPRVAAVGAATAAASRRAGWTVDLVPRHATAARLLVELTGRLRKGQKVLLPQGSRALPTLAAGLAKLGAKVHAVETYSNEPAALDARERSRATRAARAPARAGGRTDRTDRIAAVTFASPSAVEGLERALGPRTFRALLARSPAVAIGPTTASALAARHISTTIADPHSLRSLASVAHRVATEAHAS